MDRVLALDDDSITLEIIKTCLENEGFEVHGFTQGEVALEKVKALPFDLIISDLLMPTMKGDDFLKEVKKIQPDVPFIFLTAKDDLLTAVQLMKAGADDYLHKPFHNMDLLMRSRKAIKDKRYNLFIQKTLNENQVNQLNEKSIIHWKRLYGVKDTSQTSRIMHYLSRNIEQGGGFMWLDLLKAQMESTEDQEIPIERSVLQLVVESASRTKKILDDLNYISSISEMSVPLEEEKTVNYIPHLVKWSQKNLSSLCEKYKRKLVISSPKEITHHSLKINRSIMEQLCHELTCNALKYSPEGTDVILMITINRDDKHHRLEVSFWNDMKQTVTKDYHEDGLRGIPYEFSESVFELFHTLEGFPYHIDEEVWSNGTGLFAVRELINKMDGIVEAGNTVMHIDQEPHPYVKVTLYIPLVKE